MTGASNTSKNWKITKRIITISWSGADSFEYNAALQGVQLSASNFVTTEAVTLLLTMTSSNPVTVTSSNSTVGGADPNFTLASSQASLLANVQGKNAGSYQANVSLGAAFTDNYTLSGTVQKIFAITKKVISLTWSGASSFTYNTQNQGLTLTVSGILGSDANLVEFMLTIAGQVTLIGVGIITTGQRKLANGSHSFVATNAGAYSVQIGANPSGTSGANYSISASPSLTGAFTIAKKNITIQNWYVNSYTIGGSNTQYTNSSFTYNGTARTVVPGYLDGATLATDGRFYTSDLSSTPTFSYQGDTNTQTNAGSYTTQAAISSSSDLYANYVISAGATLNWLISQQTITVSFSGSSSFTYNGQNQGVTATVSGIIGSEQVKLTTTTNVTSKGFDSNTLISNGTFNFYSKNAGSYSVSVTGVNDTNYKLNNPPINSSFTISQLTIQLSWGTTTFEYNAGQQGPLLPTISNKINLDDVILSWNDGVDGGTTYSHLQTNKGNYDARISSTLTGLDAGNYTLTGVTLTKDWKIVAKKISFTFTASSLTYSGSYSQIGTLEVVGVFAGDTVKLNVNVTAGVRLVYSSNEYFDVTGGISTGGVTPTHGLSSGVTYGVLVKDAGAYTFTINTSSLIATHAPNSNYEIDTTYSQTFTMQRRALTLTFFEYYHTKLAAYSYEYDTTYQGVRVQVGNIVSSEQIYVYIGVTGGTPIKIYTVYNSGTNTFTNDLGSATNVYTSGGTSFDIGLTGVNYGNYSAAISHVIDTNGNSSATGGNYSLPTTKSQSFDIEKKELTIDWQSTTTYTYDKTTKSVTAVAGGLISPDTASFVYSETGELQEGRKLKSSAINYGLYRSLIIGLTAGSNTNYKLPTSGLHKDWQIDQRVVDITWPSTVSFVYDGTQKSVNGTISNIVSGDTVSLVYETTGTTNIDGVIYTHATCYKCRKVSLKSYRSK